MVFVHKYENVNAVNCIILLAILPCHDENNVEVV